MLTDRHAESSAAVAESLLPRFSGYVARHLGLRFPRSQWPELLRAADAIACEGGVAGAAACMEGVMAAAPTRAAIEQLARHLTIGETYFFREPALFDALERDVLPLLIDARRAGGKTLRIWSAGCCTGEELYSLAILLHRLIPDLADWRITLLGTDINPQFLRKAEQGVYRDWSFRNVPEWIRRRYFDAGAIAPVLRQGVRFDYLNLAAGVFPGTDSGTPPMDLILCRNVLMYFEPSSAARTVLRLRDALAADGWLAVGVAENGHRLLEPLEPVRFGAAQLYRQPGPVAAGIAAIIIRRASDKDRRGAARVRRRAGPGHMRAPLRRPRPARRRRRLLRRRHRRRLRSRPALPAGADHGGAGTYRRRHGRAEGSAVPGPGFRAGPFHARHAVPALRGRARGGAPFRQRVEAAARARAGRTAGPRRRPARWRAGRPDARRRGDALTMTGRRQAPDWEALRARLAAAAAAAARQDTAPGPEQRRALLLERARRLAQEPPAEVAPAALAEVLEFMLADEHYAVEMAHVHEVHVLRELTPLPGAPAFVLGIVNVRGRILSLVDLLRFFGLPERGLSDMNKIIVLRDGAMRFGVLADQILGVNKLVLAELRQPPAVGGIRADYLKGITAQRLILFDAGRLLADPAMVVDQQ